MGIVFGVVSQGLESSPMFNKETIHAPFKNESLKQYDKMVGFQENICQVGRKTHKNFNYTWAENKYSCRIAAMIPLRGWKHDPALDPFDLTKKMTMPSFNVDLAICWEGLATNQLI